MRKAILSLLLLSFIAVGIAVAGDEASTSVITVKGSAKNTGVVTLEVTKDSKSYELTCNETMPSCAELKKGNYRMLELPKNRGVYECRNVRVYPESAANADDAAQLGEYCLVTQ